MTASGGERAALVEAVMPFLDEWQALLKDIRALTPERVNAMLDRAVNLRGQADRAMQGGIVHHLEVCIECLNAPALDRRGFGEALRNLSEVTWQLKQEVGPSAKRGPPSPADAELRSIAEPPLLDPAALRSPAWSSQPAPVMPLASRSGVEPPPPLSLPGAAQRLGAAPGAAPNAPERAAPPVSPLGLGRSQRSGGGEAPRILEGRRAPGARPFEPAGPGIIPAAGGHGIPPAAGGRAMASKPAPQILGPRVDAAPRPKDKPNLMVATMFGLRAFGRGKAPAASPPAGAPGRPPKAVPSAGVLGLGRRASSDPSGAPAWIGPRAGGLPELGTGGPSLPPEGAAADLDQRLRRLRGQEEAEERHERRASGRPPTVPPKADRVRSGRRSSRPEEDSSDAERGEGRRRESALPIPWWIGGVAVALVGLVVVGLLVFGRSPPQAAVLGKTQGAGVEAELPTSKLLDDKERMRALISLVHDYGGEESPELANLLNEEAALVYEVIEQSCSQPGDKCDRPAPMVAGTVRSGSTPRHEIKHLFEDNKIEGKRRKSGQAGSWLAGLNMPAIGAEDDPNVRRLVDYYTENQVGREEFRNMLFRCGAYQDLIEKTLVHHGMPRALLALVMTESQCVPYAESPVGARGLWQFMPATARAYHLHVTENVVDERISPPKSTEAAVRFLSDLYRKMGSWEFALASYNMGPFGLSARIKRAGGDVTFWDLAAAGALPEETAKYVPRIQAYALILENLAHFNFGAAQMRATEVTAELEAPPGTRLGMVARAASTSIDHLKLLNPDIVGMVVPDLPGSRFTVRVPKEDVFRARSVLEQLLAAGDDDDRCVSSAFDWGSEPFNKKMCGGGKGQRPL